MQISVLTEDTTLWQAIVEGQMAGGRDRAKGLHLSTVVNDIALTVWPSEFAYLKRDVGDEGEADVFDARTRALFECGHVVEDAMAQVLAQRVGWRKPAPKLCDGIWCSPDGFTPSSRTLDEMKVTWKSARDFTATPKFQVYQYQVLSYMHVYGATRARLHVLHANGDWRPPRPMPPTTYILRPSATEIRDNWRMVQTHARDRGWLGG